MATAILDQLVLRDLIRNGKVSDTTLGLANAECPNCGKKDIDDNGCSGAQASYVCTACGHS